MAEKLPPLNPLKVFEAVARLNSVTKASRELFITQAAVSRQVYVLEDYLQEQLFVHRRGKITLTDEGRFYFEAISPSLKKIARATDQLLKNKNRNVVRVRTYPTFAHYWLVPRLPLLRKLHPEIEVHIVTEVQPADPTQVSNDIIIQLGEENWHGFVATKLLEDRIAPICSPEFKESRGLTGDVEELSRLPLLHSDYRRRDWIDWLQSINGEEPSPKGALHFRSSVLTYQAAQHGLGVAIGQLELLGEEIAAGRLVVPYGPPLTRPLAYYLLHVENAMMPTSSSRFIEWLIGEAKASAAHS